MVLQVTVSKSTVARTRKESQGEGIVTRSGWKGGHVKRLNFASSLRSNRQQCLIPYHDVAPYTDPYVRCNGREGPKPLSTLFLGFVLICADLSEFDLI